MNAKLLDSYLTYHNIIFSTEVSSNDQIQNCEVPCTALPHDDDANYLQRIYFSTNPFVVNMNLIASKQFLAVLGLFLGLISQGDTHGVEVRHCLTADAKLRIFVEHWHNDLTSVTQPGGLKIRNDVNGTETVLTPTGLANNIDVDNGDSLPGCPAGVNATLASTCGNVENDWVFYDFPFSCNANISYTLLQGLTVYLTEACDNLYPATIAPYENCPTAPSSSPSFTPTVIGGKGGKGKKSKAPSVKKTEAPSVKKTKAPSVKKTKAPSSKGSQRRAAMRA